MKRIIITFFVGTVFGSAFGLVAGLFLFPYLFPPPVAKEKVTAEEKSSGLVARGMFIHVNRSDPIHYGQGKVTVYKRLVHLEADFEVGPGPDYRVYLAPRQTVRKEADVTGTGFVDLGKLRSFEGSQKYVIPPDLDPAKYQSVVIWCRQFGVLISPADLKAAQ